MFAQSSLVKRLVRLALDEDLSYGDITSQILSNGTSEIAQAKIIAREALVVCGLDIISLVAQELNSEISVALKVKEGALVKEGAVLAELSGPASALLSAERTILNFLQRLSGVATNTREFVEAAKSKLVILDTRKTMPGWRVLDKYATRVGGARNHRMHLGDMILIKNNHIDAHPHGMRGILQTLASKSGLSVKVEVEVRNLNELKQALPFAPEIIMLDNMNDQQVASAMHEIAKAAFRPFIEVSGGVTAKRLRSLAKLGVDGVSIGRLTTNARNMDISMRMTRRGR